MSRSDAVQERASRGEQDRFPVFGRSFRTLIVASSGAALLGASACAAGGGGPEGETPDPQAGGAAALEKFDPCTFFQPDQLTSWGYAAEAQEAEGVSFEPGCEWEGENAWLSLLKNADETVDSYETSTSWDSYEKKTIGGRPGAVALEAGTTGQGTCTVLIDAGGGVAVYGIDGSTRDSIDDPCGETEKIANETAAELPK
ncbi:DUF3558 family protein [Saccharopolyspora montiporae]|nr:DUF3558 family protein [Saccharopolyspora sp. HNM0983]